MWKKIVKNMREEAVGEERVPEGYSHQERRGWGHSNISSMSTATAALGSASAPHRLWGRAGDPLKDFPYKEPHTDTNPSPELQETRGYTQLQSLPSFNLCPASGCGKLH